MNRTAVGTGLQVYLHTCFSSADFIRSVFRKSQKHMMESQQLAHSIPEGQRHFFTPKVQEYVVQKLQAPSDLYRLEERPTQTTETAATATTRGECRTRYQAIVHSGTTQRHYLSTITHIRICPPIGQDGGESVSYSHSCECGRPEIYGLPCAHNAKHAQSRGWQRHEIADPRFLASAWVAQYEAAGEYGEVRC